MEDKNYDDIYNYERYTIDENKYCECSCGYRGKSPPILNIELFDVECIVCPNCGEILEEVYEDET